MKTPRIIAVGRVALRFGLSATLVEDVLRGYRDEMDALMLAGRS